MKTDPLPDTSTRLVVDTDAGVDDALALLWLLTQTEYPLELLGISTVAGNASLEDVTQNVLTVLEWAGREDIPVVMGAASPLQREPSQINQRLHGPDGMWSAAKAAGAVLEKVSGNLLDVYRSLASKRKPYTLLALGPLTNIAHLLDSDPGLLQCTERLLALGGSRRFAGSPTPLSTFNIWADPEAATRCLTAGLPITLVTKEAYGQLKLPIGVINRLELSGGPAKELARPLRRYASAQALFSEPKTLRVPDLVAAALALDPSLGNTASGLVQILSGEGITRGLTLIGLTQAECWWMTASEVDQDQLAKLSIHKPRTDLKDTVQKILARQPHNAQIILNLHPTRKWDTLLSSLGIGSINR